MEGNICKDLQCENAWEQPGRSLLEIRKRQTPLSLFGHIYEKRRVGNSYQNVTIGKLEGMRGRGRQRGKVSDSLRLENWILAKKIVGLVKI